jgi:hypothetical protein
MKKGGKWMVDFFALTKAEGLSYNYWLANGEYKEE